MLEKSKAYSGFSVNDISAAKVFYGQTLGLNINETAMGLTIELGSGAHVFIYPKPNHEPATYTILNFPVDNIDEAVAGLKAKGIRFENYEGMTDEYGIARGLSIGRGPDIAWFKDPAGNIISVLNEG